MEGVFLLSLVAATSAAALAYAARRGRSLPRAAFRAAVGRALECIGLTAAFFVSLYLSTDVSLLVLSALQALVFQHWLASSRRGSPDDGGG